MPDDPDSEFASAAYEAFGDPGIALSKTEPDFVDALDRLDERLDAQAEQLKDMAAALNRLADPRTVPAPSEIESARSLAAEDATVGVVVATQLSTTGQLAFTVSEIEFMLLQRSAAMRAGDQRRVADLELEAAALTCEALHRAVDDLVLPSDFDDVLPANTDGFLRGQDRLLDTGGKGGAPQQKGPARRSAAVAAPAPATVSSPPRSATDMDLDAFIALETSLMTLAGLSAQLAAHHVRAAVTNYRRLPPKPIGNSADLLEHLEDARDVVCQIVADTRSARRGSEREFRRRRRVRLVATALGGTMLATVNTAAGGFLIPPLIAASAVLGGGAAGAVATMLAG